MLSIYSIRVSSTLTDSAAVVIFLQGVVFIPLAIGIHKHSRIAAILALGVQLQFIDFLNRQILILQTELDMRTPDR